MFGWIRPEHALTEKDTGHGLRMLLFDGVHPNTSQPAAQHWIAPGWRPASHGATRVRRWSIAWALTPRDRNSPSPSRHVMTG